MGWDYPREKRVCLPSAPFFPLSLSSRRLFLSSSLSRCLISQTRIGTHCSCLLSLLNHVPLTRPSGSSHLRLVDTPGCNQPYFYFSIHSLCVPHSYWCPPYYANFLISFSILPCFYRFFLSLSFSIIIRRVNHRPQTTSYTILFIFHSFFSFLFFTALAFCMSIAIFMT
ncbi:MAG: hypothetical protein JOS17DRAFT_757881 [Linnemannia elongata]|nr:MAG: hypothetical protein JOS17DRAFT_757881 [Linnemannia elongata]